MSNEYDQRDIWGLLFVFNIENTRDDDREELIVSKNINDNVGLAQLFDAWFARIFLSWRTRTRFVDANSASFLRC